MLRNRKVQPILAATIIGVGFAAAVLTLWVGVVGYLESLRADSDRQTVEAPFVPEHIVIAKDGTPLIAGSKRGPSSEQNFLAYRDVNGATVPVHVGEQHLPSVMLASYEAPGDFAWPHRMLLYGVPGETETELWYFVHDGRVSGRGRFIGYRWKSHEKVGYISAAGFSEEEPNLEDWFHTDPNLWMVLTASLQAIGGHGAFASIENVLNRFHSGDKRAADIFVRGLTTVHHVDLRGRTAAKIYESADEPPISLSVAYATGPAGKQFPRQIHIRTRTRVLVADDPLAEQAIPESLREQEVLEYVRVNDQQCIFQTPRTERSDSAFTIYQRIFHTSRAGVIGSSQEILLRVQPIQPTPPPVLLPFWALSSPLVLDFMAFVFAPLEAMIRFDKTYLDAHATFTVDLSRNGIRLPLLFFVFTHLFPVLPAAYAWRRGGQYGESLVTRKVWTAFVYLTGIPGLVGYLLHRSWPVSEVCSSCGASTPVSLETCSACGKQADALELTGTEIFG